MYNRILFYITLIAVSLVLFTGCDRLITQSSAAQSEAATEDFRFNVRTAPVSTGTLSSYINLSGNVEASVSVEVYPDAAGKLTRVLVQPGSIVKAGDILGWVDPSRPGMIYVSSPIKAPINGTITSVIADPGSTVSSQMPLFGLGQINELVVTTQVPERFLYLVEPGQVAAISTTAAPDRSFKAKVTSLSPVVNPISRTLQVELSLMETSPVKAGMFVGIRLITSTEENALMVPEKTLIHRSGETFVYRIQDDTAEKVVVTTGLESSGMIEILTGLEAGDSVVIEGASLLSPGSKVKVINELSLGTTVEGSQL